jgi:flagellin
MRINHNISSMTTQGSIFKLAQSLSKSIEKLSTGLRINSAADDAAGLGVSEQLRTQVRGLSQALKNTQDSIAMLNIADGALEEQAAILQRMRELVIQAKNDTYTATERGYMYTEFKGMMNELDRIAQVTNFNGMQLFATPEATGMDAGTNLYDDDYANGFNTGEYKTNHATNDAADIWTDKSKSIFGQNDISSANHFNMMVGANYDAADRAAFDAGTASYGDRKADNMVTIQFGQMDANTLLTIAPSGAFLGDARNTWSQFEMNTALDGGGMPQDLEDFAIWFLSGLSDPTLAVDNTGEKMNLLLQVIDGDGADWGFDLRQATGNMVAPDFVNVTGLERVNRMRAAIGAWTNRLEHSINNSINQINNTQAAESQIRDVDFASETAQFTRSNILNNAATAMLAQANSSQQSVLQLIGR